MFQLPPALAALASYRQFIVCQFTPSTRRPGKTEKYPIDWRTGRVVDAHDPAIWLTCDEAAGVAASFGADYGVGFVFTATDPFFFIDVDSCVAADGASWNRMAMELLSRFEGAAVEVSHSMSGLHIIGTGTAPTPRKVKYLDQFDLYTEGRFVALTGTNALGNAVTLHDAALAVLVVQYLMPDPVAEGSGDWTDAPCAGWNGPTDDAVLLERALRSSSAASAFGTRASFRDLWEGDEVVLGKMYPDDHGRGAYDESKADSALAQHLAFWTGKDCERILRLMKQSALVREKWDRDDYIRGTILKVIARQYDVLYDKPAEVLAGNMPPAPTGGARGHEVTGDTFLSPDEQLTLFQGCIYVRDEHRVLVPGGYMLKPDQFRVTFGGYTYPMDPANEKISRNAWEAFTESQCYRSPRADSTCFRPEHPPGAIVHESGRTLANLWWPIETPQAEGDASRFLRHLATLIPNERDRAILLAYMAALVQFPGVKFQWAPLVQGLKGNGKTFFGTALTHCVSHRYTHLPNAKELGESGMKFTGWLKGKLLIVVEEIKTSDRRETLDALLPLITNARIEIQAKGQDQTTGDNRANLIFFSNHKDAIPKTTDERRYAIFFTAQQDFTDLARDGLDGNYFPDLYDWAEGRNRYAGQPSGWAIINHYLRNYAIPDELNPATKLHRAPETSSTAEAIDLSIGRIEQEVLEAIDQELPGFAGGWVSSMALDRLLVRLKADARIPPRKRKTMMETLGYDWHPHLLLGRTDNAVEPDGGKTRLYIRKGHILGAIENRGMIAKNYTDAQKRAMERQANYHS